jgi:hypothetical protein
MKYYLLTIVACVAACGPKPVEVSGVQVAMISDVGACERKGTVTGVPGVFGPLKDYGLQDARKRALQLAPRLGADTVVFDPVTDAAVITEVTGTAYDCSVS